MPVAGTDTIYNEILSAPCRFYVASVVDGQCSTPVKATERQFTIKQNRYLRTAGIPVHIIQMSFNIQILKRNFLFLSQLPVNTTAPQYYANYATTGNNGGASSSDDAAAQPHESASSSFIVKNALKYIESNYNQKLTLCEVAEKTYVSQWHLSKLLNRHTGQSFSDILNHCRIEHAKKLLEDPSLRIGDISDAVGFLDLAHFSRVFKKQEGMSANEWRNQKLGS